MLLVPAFTPTLTSEPSLKPYFAFGFCCALNSCMASMGTRFAVSPARYDVFRTFAPVLSAIPAIPSSRSMSFWVFRPLVLCPAPVPLPTGVDDPGPAGSSAENSGHSTAAH